MNGAALLVTIVAAVQATALGCSASTTSTATSGAAAVQDRSSDLRATVTSSTVLVLSDGEATGEGDSATIRAGAPPSFLPRAEGSASPGVPAPNGSPVPAGATAPTTTLALRGAPPGPGAPTGPGGPTTAAAATPSTPPMATPPTVAETAPATAPPTTPLPTAPAPTAPPPTAPAASGNWDLAGEQRFVTLLNAERAAVGLAPLTVEGGLRASARAQVTSMMSTQVLAHQDLHDDLDGGWSIVGENVGYGPDPEAIHAALVASPGHYANLVHTSYRMVGIGVHVDANGRMWVSQVFGG